MPGAVLLEQAQGHARLARAVVGRCLAEHGAWPARPAKDSLLHPAHAERGDCFVWNRRAEKLPGQRQPRVQRSPGPGPAGKSQQELPVERRSTAADDLRDVAEEPEPERRPRSVDREVEERVLVREQPHRLAADAPIGRSLDHVGERPEMGGIPETGVDLEAHGPGRRRAVVLHVVERMVLRHVGRQLAPHPALSDRQLSRLFQVVRADQQVDVGRRTQLEAAVEAFGNGQALHGNRVETGVLVRRDESDELVGERQIADEGCVGAECGPGRPRLRHPGGRHRAGETGRDQRCHFVELRLVPEVVPVGAGREQLTEVTLGIGVERGPRRQAEDALFGVHLAGEASLRAGHAQRDRTEQQSERQVDRRQPEEREHLRPDLGQALPEEKGVPSEATACVSGTASETGWSQPGRTVTG